MYSNIVNRGILLLVSLLSIFIGTESLKAQDCGDPRLEVEVVGYACSSKASIIVTVVTNGGTIDISKNKFILTERTPVGSTSIAESDIGSNVIKNVDFGGPYSIAITDIKCNGNKIMPTYTGIMVAYSWKLDKAEFMRCTSGNIVVKAQASQGNGPYKYELIDNGSVIASATEPNGIEASFNAVTTSDDLQVKVSDMGCLANSPITKIADKVLDLGTIVSVLEGEKDACVGGKLALAVKSIYKGSNFKWEKGGAVVSTSSTLTIENASESDAGEYNFSMDFDGCGVPFTEQVQIKVGKAPSPNVTTPVNSCLNSPVFSLSSYASATSGTYTLVWYNSGGTIIGETAPIFNPNTVGTYKYYVSQKSATGCESDKVELTVTVNNPPLAIGANNVIFCSDPSNPDPKMIVINAGNYIYNLYDSYAGTNKVGTGTAVNDTAIIISGALTIGSDYYLETEDLLGCVSTSRTTVKVTVKESLIIGATKLCFGDNIVLTADYPGGVITWTKPDNTTYVGKTLTISNVDFSDGGLYKVLIEESGLGCTMTDQVSINISRPTAPVVATTSYRYYQNETPVAMAATANTGLKLHWYDPSGNLILTSGAPQQSPVPPTNKLGAFVYNVSQDSLGCESSKVAVTVVIGEVPDPVPAADINICLADKPLIQIDNTIQDYIYTVYYKDAVIAQGTGNGALLSIYSTVSITENAIFEIDVTDLFGIQSVKIAKNVISVNNLIDAQSDAFICVGSQGTVKAVDVVNASSYTWTNPSGTDFVGKTHRITNAANNDSGQYILTVDMQGCPSSAKQTMRVNVSQPAIPVVATTSYRYYQNETPIPMTATAETGNMLHWYNPSGNLILTSGVPTQSPVPPTNILGVFVYNVAQDSAGCESPMVEVTVIVGEVPDPVPVSDINICIADKPVIQINNTIANYTYTVYYKNEVIASGIGNGASLSLTSTVSVTENTELEIVVTDTFGVVSPKTKVKLISIHNLIDATQTSLNICEGSQGILTAITISNASNYTWTTPGGSILTGQSVTVTNADASDAGKYILAVTMQGCPNEAKQSIEISVAKPANPVTAKEVYYCVNDVATPLTATSLAGYHLVWFNAAGNQELVAPTPNTSVAAAYIYYVSQVSNSDANCTSDLEEITVYVENRPETLILDPISVCAGNPILVTIPNSINGYTYSLFTQESGGTLVGKVIGDGFAVNIPVNDEIASEATFYLQIENKANCTAIERTPVSISVIALYLLPNELPSYQIDEFYTERLETNAADPKYSIIQGYLPAGFTISMNGTISGIAASYADPADFTVEVTNDMGCSVQKNYTLKSELLVAKMFSPNGDGINDVFMKGYKVTVFDRLGRKLYSGASGWDGSFNGKIVPEDVYYYIIYYNDPVTGQEKKTTGYTTLIKTI